MKHEPIIYRIISKSKGTVVVQDSACAVSIYYLGRRHKDYILIKSKGDRDKLVDLTGCNSVDQIEEIADLTHV